MPEFELQGLTQQYDAMDAFTQGYIQAVFFAETPEDEEWQFNELSQHAIDRAVEDCRAFQDSAEVQRLIEGRERKAGADLLFTRQGHGCGFWDGEWDDVDEWELLNRRAKALREVNFYKGDDGLIYC